MRQKIIFIDVDGPLAWGTWNDGKVIVNEGINTEFTIPYPWVKEDCDALKIILNETNSKLVLSSDWRFQFAFRQMKDIFQHYGIHSSNLLDMTCQFSLWNKMSRTSLEHERALQIVKWAKDNKISNWIAIDDLDLYHTFKWLTPKTPMWRHVQVDGDHGVGGRLRDKIEECILKLNR
jgi:hypothetical protein